MCRFQISLYFLLSSTLLTCRATLGYPNVPSDKSRRADRHAGISTVRFSTAEENNGEKNRPVQREGAGEGKGSEKGLKVEERNRVMIYSTQPAVIQI